MKFCAECGAMLQVEGTEFVVEDDVPYEKFDFECPDCGYSGTSKRRQKNTIVEEERDDVGRGISTRDNDHPLEQ